jgi:hypothetical protein
MADSDPVAAKSGFLCMYMSNHPDTLVSYVKYIRLRLQMMFLFS